MSRSARRKRRRGNRGAKQQQRGQRQDGSAGSDRRPCQSIRWRLLLASPGLVPALSSLLISWPGGPIVQKLLGAVAMVLLGFHCVNTKTRIRLKHWATPSLVPLLRREVVLGIFVPLLVVLGSVLLPPTWPVLLAMGTLFGLAHSLYEPIEEEIHLLVEREGLRHGTSRFGERKPFHRLTSVDEDLAEIAKRKHEAGAQRALTFFLKPSWRPRLSRTRTVILYVLLTSTCAALGASFQVGVGEGEKQSPPVTEAAPEKEADPEPGVPDGDGGEGEGEGEADTAEDLDESWETACWTLPEYGAPAWARAELNALYLGGMDLNATPPPGTAGGCTGKAVVIELAGGDFVYTTGRNKGGEVLSAAVVSRQMGPALFLAPAAQRVLEMIRDGMVPLGGLPTMDVVNGDVTGIETEVGTFALVRSEKHLRDRLDLAFPHQELAPPAAMAWMGAMNEHGGWLWPVLTTSKEGVETFVFSTDPEGTDPRFTVVYDSRAGIAWRGRYRYYLPQPAIDQETLEDLVRGTH